MVRLKRLLACGSLAIMIGALAWPASALAGGHLPSEPAGPQYGEPVSSEQLKAAHVAPLATASAFVAVTGDGALITASYNVPCSNATCDSSKGDCECDTYSGTFTVSPFGKANFSFNNTVNTDDTVASGGGSGGVCFPFSGTGTISSGKNAVNFVANGTACNEFDFSASNAIFINQAAYYITPGQGTGKYAAARGSGNMVLTLDFSSNTGTAHINGNIQP